jgi:hypothetical protein
MTGQKRIKVFLCDLAILFKDLSSPFFEILERKILMNRLTILIDFLDAMLRGGRGQGTISGLLEGLENNDVFIRRRAASALSIVAAEAKGDAQHGRAAEDSRSQAKRAKTWSAARTPVGAQNLKAEAKTLHPETVPKPRWRRYARTIRARQPSSPRAFAVAFRVSTISEVWAANQL